MAKTITKNQGSTWNLWRKRCEKDFWSIFQKSQVASRKSQVAKVGFYHYLGLALET
jgi:hypothetical protein